MKKWNSLKNLNQRRGNSEDLGRKSLKRQASSPYLRNQMIHSTDKIGKKTKQNVGKSSSHDKLFKNLGGNSNHYRQGEHSTETRSLSKKKMKHLYTTL